MNRLKKNPKEELLTKVDLQRLNVDPRLEIGILKNSKEMKKEKKGTTLTKKSFDSGDEKRRF